jgi:transcriptional regulator with XRE-family HTH domain
MDEPRSESTPNQRSANSVDSHVGSRVRLRRLELGLSQEKLAEQLGITFQQVQKYERGTNRIGASRLHQIALVLQAPITYFFEGASESALPRAGEQSPLALALSDPATVRLVRAFASIADPQLKQKAVGIIEAIADTTHPSGDGY